MLGVALYHRLKGGAPLLVQNLPYSGALSDRMARRKPLLRSAGIPDDAIYIDIQSESVKARNIRRDPRVAVLLDAAREVRIALLEADVALPVVRRFIDSVTEQAVGQSVLKSVTPGQQVVKIVKDELEAALRAELAAIANEGGGGGGSGSSTPAPAIRV